MMAASVLRGVPDHHAEERRSYVDFVISQADEKYRVPLQTQYEKWADYNNDHFDGGLIEPHLWIGPTRPAALLGAEASARDFRLTTGLLHDHTRAHPTPGVRLYPRRCPMTGLLLLLGVSLPWILFLGVVIPTALPTGSQVTSKPLAWFKVKSNSRKTFDEVALRLLGQQLRIRQLQPLVCLPDGTIVCGERRYRAAVLEGLAELNVTIITDPITEAEFDRLQLVENLQRQDLSNSEKCAGCVKFVRNNPGMTFKEVAQALGVDPVARHSLDELGQGDRVRQAGPDRRQADTHRHVRHLPDAERAAGGSAGRGTCRA